MYICIYVAIFPLLSRIYMCVCVCVCTYNIYIYIYIYTYVCVCVLLRNYYTGVHSFMHTASFALIIAMYSSCEREREALVYELRQTMNIYN